MSFVRHAESYGLVLDHAIEDGRWHRCKTLDKPRRKNGAYLFDGVRGVVRNWATMNDYAAYREDGTAERISQKDYRELQRKQRARQESLWVDAGVKAEDMLKRAAFQPHPYLAAKGFPQEAVWVLDGELLVPMRDANNPMRLNSVQRITEGGTKLFLAGGKAKGSVLKLGNERAQERWLVEGYATGLSVREALRDLRRSYQVIVCFSASNMIYVAKSVRRPAFVVADNDASKTGAEAAEATGLPWIMPAEVGMDANDLHQRRGLRALVRLIQAEWSTTTIREMWEMRAS